MIAKCCTKTAVLQAFSVFYHYLSLILNKKSFIELSEDNAEEFCPEQPNSFLSPSVDSFIWLAPDDLVQSEQTTLAQEFYQKYTDDQEYQEHWSEQNSWFVAEKICNDHGMKNYEAKDALSVWALAKIIGKVMYSLETSSVSLLFF